MSADRTKTLIVSAPDPYQFALFYAIHARYPHPALFTLSDGHYQRFMRHPDSSLWSLDVSVAEDNPDALTAVIHTEGDFWDDAYYRQAAQHLMGLDADITAFYAYAQATPQVWQLIEPLYGLPLYRAENLYEALVFVIIEQHISWVSAQRAQQAIISLGQEEQAVLMLPDELANKTVDDLRPLKITFKRMRLLISIAQQIVGGELALDALQAADPQTIYDALLKIKGVGHWTASVVVARATGQYQFVPHNDVALQAAVARYFDTDKSADATRAVFAQFGDYAGLAAHFTLMRWVLDEYPVTHGQ